MGDASPYLGAVRAEHVGPAARSLRFALLEPPGLGALLSGCGGPMYAREVRSGNSRRKVRNKGGTTTRRPSLTLLDPLLMNFSARVSHHHSPYRAAVRTCRAAMEYGVDVHGDSYGVYPALCRDQRPRVSSGKWHGYTPPGLPSCRTSGRRRALERSC